MKAYRMIGWLALVCLMLPGCTAPPRPAPAVKLTILGLTPQAGAQLREDGLDDFTRRTGIQVEIIPTSGASAEQTALALKLLAQHAAVPDIYMVDVIWTGTLHEYLLDLSPYLTEETRSHLPALLKIGTVRNRVTSLPFYMNTGVLYYRQDLFKKYGYRSPPETWDELAGMAKQIQEAERRQGDSDFWGYVWQGSAYEGLTCNALEWQASFGGGRIIETGGEVTVNNPRAVRAMRTAAGWVGSISPKSVLSYTESDSLHSFVSGNAAFLRHWSSAFRRISDAMGPDAVGVARLPAGPAGRAYAIGGFQLAVSRYSEQPAEAAALVLHLTGKDVEMRRAVKHGYLPTYSELYQRAEIIQALPQSRVLQDSSADRAVVRPSTVTGNKYAEVSKDYYQTVHGILSHKVGADAALAGLAQRLRELTGVESAASERKHEGR